VTDADPIAELQALAAVAAGCTACRLAEGRTNVVFGAGDPAARLMFVGEGPGRDEDLQGLPFVGRSGRLLEELLAQIGLRRDEVYIANVVKCRPPNNRDPLQDEIDACKGYLRDQITLIDPEVVVTLGNFATKLLLRTEVGISRLRGTAHRWWGGRTLVPTFHPAAALRGGPRVRSQMEEDLALVRRVLDAPRPAVEPAGTDGSGVGEDDPPESEQLGLFR
jgi:uracil-DNA glycosylase